MHEHTFVLVPGKIMKCQDRTASFVLQKAGVFYETYRKVLTYDQLKTNINTVIQIEQNEISINSILQGEYHRGLS